MGSFFCPALMTNVINRIRFDPLPNKAGGGWYLLATHPDGQKEHINGFTSAFEAIFWIGSSQREDWLKARGEPIRIRLIDSN